jgi:DNA-binding LacI/PurR family transcriptional regulator
MNKKISIRDIAKAANVSHMTISRVINNYKGVAEETRQHVLKIITRMNYDPSRNSSFLQKIKKRTKTIGLVGPTNKLEEHDFFINRAICEFKNNVDQLGCNGVLYNARELGDWMDQQSSPGRRDMLADGLVFFCPVGDWEKQVRGLYRQGVPMVLVRRKTDLPGIPVITNDDAAAVRQVLEHVYALGHRRIAFCGHWIFDQDAVPEQEEAYCSFLKEKGLPFSEDLLFDSREKSRNDLAAWLQNNFAKEGRGFTALFCLNDIDAMAAIQIARQLGQQVPRDLAVIGYDNTPMAELFSPAITSVNVPVKEMMDLALQLLAKLMRNERIEKMSYELGTELVVRESCGYKQPETDHKKTFNR